MDIGKAGTPLAATQELNPTPAETADAAEAQQPGEPGALGVQNAAADKVHLDFLTALILIAVSVGVIITSQNYFQQQLKRKICTTFYESAGFMPTVFAGFLLVMSVMQLVQSLRKAGLAQRLSELAAAFGRTVRSVAVYKTLGGLAIFAVYIYALLGRLYFGWASLLVLFGTLFYVYFDRRALPKVALKALLISALAVAGIVGLFQYAFSVPMP